MLGLAVFDHMRTGQEDIPVSKAARIGRRSVFLPM